MLLAGCLPHSCGQPVDTGALQPADSLSRQVAATMPVDTLRRVWRAAAGDSLQLRFPRTALFLQEGSAAGRLVVSDAQRGALLFFSEGGRLARTMAPEDAFSAPYLIGRRADTLVVLSPRPRRVSFVAGGRVVRTQTLALPPAREAPLLWGAAQRGALFAKTISAEGQATITRHGPRGQVTARRRLDGPRWHHAGPLRAWGGALTSLSGFRPVVRRLPPGLGSVDTLRLAGFDSPMLARSRRFAEGDVRQPPLLMPDAAAAGRLLFVLNLRPGRLHIDAFGPDGQLAARLTAPGPAQNRDVYPRALAVRQRPDGSYALAVALTAPQPAVALYRWTPAEGDEGAATAARAARP